MLHLESEYSKRKFEKTIRFEIENEFIFEIKVWIKLWSCLKMCVKFLKVKFLNSMILLSIKETAIKSDDYVQKCQAKLWC